MIAIDGTDRVTLFIATDDADDLRARARPSAWPASRPGYIDSGAEIPSRPRALARVVIVAATRARRAAERLGSAGVDHLRVAVEGMERRRQLGRVGGDPLRLLGRGRVLDDLGQADDLADQAGLRAVGRASDAPIARPARARPRLPCAGSRRSGRGRTGRSRPGSRSTASWPARCRSRSPSVGAARGEEPAGGVDADLAEQLVEGDERAGPLAHRDLDAVADEADPGDRAASGRRPCRSPSPRPRCGPGPPCRGGRRPRCRSARRSPRLNFSVT